MSFQYKVLSLAVLTALSLPSWATVTNQTSDIGVDENIIINDGDELHFIDNSDSIIRNDGVVSGGGTISIETFDKLENHGILDVANYTSGPSGILVNENDGTVYLNKSELSVWINNKGKIISRTGRLLLKDAVLNVYAGSSITKEDGSRLDKIHVIQNSNAYPVIEKGALLEADSILIDTKLGQLKLQGTLIGDDITVKGSAMEMGQDSHIEGKRITLTQIDQNGSDNKDPAYGGKIIATESLHFTSFIRLNDMQVTAPDITFDGAANLQKNTHISDVKKISTKSTISLYDSAQINNGTIDSVTFLGVKADNGPRIQLMGENPLVINHFLVEKSVNTNSGKTISANLVDKMPITQEGVTSFQIHDAIIQEGAILTVYADDKKAGSARTNVSFDNLTLEKDAKVELGFRSSGTFTAFAQQSVDSLTLNEGSILKTSAAPILDKKNTHIHQIYFNGNNASVQGTLVGDTTNVFVAENVYNTSIDNINVDELTVIVSTPTVSSGNKKVFTTQNIDKHTHVTLKGGANNNTGNALEDLQNVVDAVDLGNNESTQVLVEQRAEGIYDGASAYLENGQLVGIQTQRNTTISSLTEAASLNMHLWRSGMNDLNNRLGEIRDTNGKINAAWARIYTGKDQFGTLAMTNEYQAVQVGYDREIAPGVRVGTAFEWTDGDLDSVNGSGSSTLFSLAGYATWYANDGRYIDLSMKFGRLDHDLDFQSTNGQDRVDYDLGTFSVATTAGWRLPVTDIFFVEPQVELMYGRLDSADYTTSTNIHVENDQATSMIGRAGVKLGITCPNDRGTVYAHASMLHDWQGETKYAFTQNGQTRYQIEDLGDTWYEFGLGAQLNATDAIHFYADLESTSGGKVDTDYRINLGARYLF